MRGLAAASYAIDPKGVALQQKEKSTGEYVGKGQIIHPPTSLT